MTVLGYCDELISDKKTKTNMFDLTKKSEMPFHDPDTVKSNSNVQECVGTISGCISICNNNTNLKFDCKGVSCNKDGQCYFYKTKPTEEQYGEGYCTLLKK